MKQAFLRQLIRNVLLEEFQIHTEETKIDWKDFADELFATYHKEGKKFQIVDKETFYAELYNDKLDRRKHDDFNKRDFRRIADSKETWLAKGNVVLGEIWRRGDLVCYWINRSVVPKM